LEITETIKFNDKQLKGTELLTNPKKTFIKFWGSSRSGKTFLICYFIRHRARYYPGSKHIVLRYSFSNAKKTIWLQTLWPLLKEDEKLGLCKINTTEGIAIYRNGSLILLGGLEPARIDAVLASEYETIFVTEANENKYAEYENLVTRLNGTSRNSKGILIQLKLIIDLNPTVNSNWTNVLFILGLDPITREAKADFEKFGHLRFRAEDNQENLSDGYIDTLKALSPSKRKRFYEGEYGGFEGLVFPLQESNIINDFEIPEDWPRALSIDFGFHHPFVCLWIAYDSSNELIYVYKEYYDYKKTVRIHANEINKRCIHPNGKEEFYEFIVSDHASSDRATLEENNVKTEPADKRVELGIDRVEDFLPRIRIFRSLSFTIGEFESYRYKDEAKLKKDREVIKEDDNAPDCVRYYIMRKFPPDPVRSEVKEQSFFN
jgi:phage terminase large subunit